MVYILQLVHRYFKSLLTYFFPLEIYLLKKKNWVVCLKEFLTVCILLFAF